MVRPGASATLSRTTTSIRGDIPLTHALHLRLAAVALAAVATTAAAQSPV
jgi:hypothetical protein